MAVLSRPVHQVFINFRGTDVRYGFASHLVDALKRHNIKFFIDSHEQKGRPLKDIFKRIEQATVALVILSTRYAESKWCLKELATIMEQTEKGKMVAIPIFYKVKPADVRNQKGEFGCKFWRRMQNSSREEMEKWQGYLKAVSDQVGFTLDNNRSEAKFIKKVVKGLGKVLAAIPSDEGREDDSVKSYNVILALPWAWFGSAVGLIVAVLLGFSLLAETLHKYAMVALVGQAGSLVTISSRWADRSL